MQKGLLGKPGRKHKAAWLFNAKDAQKILDFAKSHRNNLKDEKFKMFTDYVQAHVQIITENMARMAAQIKQKQGQQPQDPSQQPQGQPRRGQIAQNPGTIAPKPAIQAR